MNTAVPCRERRSSSRRVVLCVTISAQALPRVYQSEQSLVRVPPCVSPIWDFRGTDRAHAIKQKGSSNHEGVSGAEPSTCNVCRWSPMCVNELRYSTWLISFEASRPHVMTNGERLNFEVMLEHHFSQGSEDEMEVRK